VHEFLPALAARHRTDAHSALRTAVDSHLKSSPLL
jgi:hypothetical protein